MQDEDTSLNGTKGDSRGVRRKAKRNGREVTTHVSIHTLHLDGLRELFRHFLRLPDGAIVEVSDQTRSKLLSCAHVSVCRMCVCMYYVCI